MPGRHVLARCDRLVGGISTGLAALRACAFACYRETLTSGRQARGQRRQLLKRPLRHAFAFPTWRSLSTKGIGRTDAAKLITALVEAADGDRRSSPASITEPRHPVSPGPAE
jgi:hypothetical protein